MAEKSPVRNLYFKKSGGKYVLKSQSEHEEVAKASPGCKSQNCSNKKLSHLRDTAKYQVSVWQVWAESQRCKLR